jgi:hypothetical protein
MSQQSSLGKIIIINSSVNNSQQQTTSTSSQDEFGSLNLKQGEKVFLYDDSKVFLGGILNNLTILEATFQSYAPFKLHLVEISDTNGVGSRSWGEGLG